MIKFRQPFLKSLSLKVRDSPCKFNLLLFGFLNECPDLLTSARQRVMFINSNKIDIY